MENKTTTELLDLLKKLVEKDGNLKDGWEEAYNELKSRQPFYYIFRQPGDLASGESMEEQIEYLKEQIKLLKRHKHDPETGDVMVRI